VAAKGLQLDRDKVEPGRLDKKNPRTVSVVWEGGERKLTPYPMGRWQDSDDRFMSQGLVRDSLKA
jgi:hypothetical protein